MSALCGDVQPRQIRQIIVSSPCPLLDEACGPRSWPAWRKLLFLACESLAEGRSVSPRTGSRAGGAGPTWGRAKSRDASEADRNQPPPVTEAWKFRGNIGN